MMRCLAEWAKITRCRAPHRQDMARQIEATVFKHQLLMARHSWHAWQEWHVQCKIQYWALQRAHGQYRQTVLMLSLVSWRTRVHAIVLHRRSVHAALQHWRSNKLRSCMVGWQSWVVHACWEQCAPPALVHVMQQSSAISVSHMTTVQACNGQGGAA